MTSPRTMISRIREPIQGPADEMPWGHDGIPTVAEYAKGRPLSSAFVVLFPAIGFWITVHETQGILWAFLCLLLLPPFWWVLMWLAIHGWIDFDD